MDKSYKILLEEISTVKDLEVFKRSIDDFVAMMFETSNDVESKLSECFSNNQVKAWLSLFKARGIKEDNPVELQKFVLSVKEVAEALPVISLGVAFDLPQSLLKKISSWFINTYNTNVLLDIQLRTDIIGGLVIMDAGSFHDYSLSKQLDQMSARGKLRLSSLLSE